jgi:hypothetical protein
MMAWDEEQERFIDFGRNRVRCSTATAPTNRPLSPPLLLFLLLLLLVLLLLLLLLLLLPPLLLLM